MAGAVLERELTLLKAGKVEFGIASQSDDAEIRRLLRENPMPGQISITLEREPNYLADADLPGERKQTIIARDKGRLVCAGACCVRKRFVNGFPRDVGYLGGLRLDAAYAGRFDILRRGYEFFRKTQTGAPADFYFTSIASDNERARRVLERGLPGMPEYAFLGEFVTALVSVTRGKKDATVLRQVKTGELTELINEGNQTRQFAPCWTDKELIAMEQLGLRQSDFVALRDERKIAGCGAIWDQRSFKQTVIRGYAPWLKLARPAVNAFGQTLHRPRLPEVGEALPNAFACHLAGRPESLDSFVSLIRLLQNEAAQRDIQLLTLGFASNDPRLNAMRKHFRFRAYRSRIYVVRWPGIGGSASELDGRILGPEVALL